MKFHHSLTIVAGCLALLFTVVLWAAEEPETPAAHLQAGLARLIQGRPSGDYLVGEVARLLPAGVLQETDEALLGILRSVAEKHAENAVVAEAYYRLGWLAKGADRRGLMAQCFLALADYAPRHPKTALGLLDVADERIRQQDLAGAREVAQRILDGFPGTEAAQTALFVAGCTYELAGDFAAMAKIFQQFREQAPNHPRLGEALVKLGHAQVELGQYEEACETLEAYLEAYPEEETVWEWQPGAKPGAGSATPSPQGGAGSATPSPRRRIDVWHWEARSNLGRAQVFLGRAEDAYQTFRDLARHDPSAWYSLGWCREMAGDPAGALEAYQWFVEAMPETPRNFTEGLQLAKAHLMLNQDEQGLAALTHAAPWTAAGRPEEREAAAHLSFAFGQRAEAGQNFDAALTGYRLTVELDPDFPRAAEARLRAGSVHEQRREWKEALPYFQAVTDDQTAPDPLRGLARMKAASCRSELGEMKQAAEELRAVIADYPTDLTIAVPARLALATCLMKRKAYDEALQVLDEAEDLETPDADLQERLQFLRPECLAGQGKHAEALELYRQFLEEAQQPALQELAEWGIAQCLEHTGPPEEARAAVENFLEKYPQSPHAPAAKELLKRLSS